MTTLQLEPGERALLKEILEEYSGDLRMEISRTDNREFREGLKTKESFLKKMIEILSA